MSLSEVSRRRLSKGLVLILGSTLVFSSFVPIAHSWTWADGLKILVTDTEGIPLAGVNVYIDTHVLNDLKLWGVTGDNGTVVFDFFHTPCTYELTLIKKGYISIIRYNFNSPFMNHMMAKIPTCLKVTVKDSMGNLLSGVALSSISHPDMDSAISGTTTTNGTVIFKGITPGNYIMQALKNGYFTESTSVSITMDSIVEATIILKPSTNNLKVTVKDNVGAPLRGATVTSTSQPIGQAPLNALTDSTGVAEFKGLISGNYTLQIIKVGYSSASSIVITDFGATKNVSYDLAILPVDLRITVKDNTGKFLSNVKVSSIQRPSGQGNLVGYTDTAGVAYFPGIKIGSYVFQLSKTKYVTSSLTVEVKPGPPSEASTSMLSGTTAWFGLEGDEETYQRVAIVIVGLLIMVGAWFLWHRRQH